VLLLPLTSTQITFLSTLWADTPNLCFFHSGKRRRLISILGIICLIFNSSKWLLHRGNQVFDSQALCSRNLNQLNAICAIVVNSSITVPLNRSLSDGFPLQFIAIITPAVVYKFELCTQHPVMNASAQPHPFLSHKRNGILGQIASVPWTWFISKCTLLLGMR
jgi:hypothetical protein